MPRGLEGRLNGNKPFKSEGERRIASTLDKYGIFYIYERPVQVQTAGTVRYLRPDFYLPRYNVYIEYYGRAGNSEYDRRITKKQSLYTANGIRVISIYPWTLCRNWPKYLMGRLARRPTYAVRTPPAKPYRASSARPYRASSRRGYR